MPATSLAATGHGFGDRVEQVTSIGGSEWLTAAHVVGDTTTVDLDSGTDAVSATVVGNDTRQAGPTAGKGAVIQFYAQFDLDSVRGIRQIGEIFEHVLGRLGPDVDLSLAIRARSEAGHDDITQRIVSENVSNLGAGRGGVRVGVTDGLRTRLH